MNGVVGNSITKELLVVDLWKTSQNYEVTTDHNRKWLKIAENNEEMQNSTSKEYGELIALRDARRIILELHQQES